jgi:type IV pilus assembly protein PilO
MLKSSKVPSLAAGSRWRNPKFVMRVVLGVLLVANLAAAALVMWPIGGSAEDLERQRIALQKQVRTQQTILDTTRQHASAVEVGRVEGDQFLGDYFLETRSAYSALISELLAASAQANIQSKEHAYVTEPIEGSDSLSMMTITGNYEGTYADLLHFVNAIDRSQRLVVIESLNAAPQQGSPRLAFNMKLHAFVRAEGVGQ